jgi:hypothetical protein
MTVPIVADRSLGWVSDTRNLIPGHLAPRGFANLALQSGIEGAFDDHDEGCRRSGVTGQQYWEGIARLPV